MSSILMHILSNTTKVFLSFLLFQVCLSLNAQSTFTDQGILQNAIRSYEENIDRINSNQEITLPQKQWIDQMEFRTEFNELDLNQQEYTFRMRFRNDEVRKLQNQLMTMQRSLLEKEIKSNINDTSENTYQQIIEWYFIQELDSLLNYKLDLLKDKNSVETTLLLTDNNVNFNDALKIKERQMEIKKDLFDLRWKKENLFKELEINDTNSRLDLIDLINIEALVEVTQNLQSLSELNYKLNTYDDRLAILEMEYQLEEEDTAPLLRFAQLRYKADEDLGLERELSLGIGFNIPYKQVNQTNLAKIELDKIEEQLKRQELLLELELDTAEEQTQLISFVNRYNYLKELHAEENLSKLKEEYLKSERVEAIPLINLELMIIDREIDLMESLQDIYMQYITTLGQATVLRFSNNTNWLDQNLRPIE